MNKEEFIKETEKLGINISQDMLNKLETYMNFLIEYNSHTNLTRIISKEDIYLKHFYDSLTITKVINFEKINNIIDIGTGAGFPGMVLKIFYPHLKVTLLDSNNKKIKFLEELKGKLNIDVELINDRVENYSKEHLNSFDLVTSRAVANLRVLSELSLPLVSKNGYFIPLKGNLDNELEESKDTISFFDGIIEKIYNFELYNNNGNRNILKIKKLKETPKENLRTYDKIIKKPLKKRHK